MIPVPSQIGQDGLWSYRGLNRLLFGTGRAPGHRTGETPRVGSVLHVTPWRRQPLVASETPQKPPSHRRERVRVRAPLEGGPQHALSRPRSVPPHEIRGPRSGDGPCALEASEASEVVEHLAIIGQGARPDSVASLFQQLPHFVGGALPETLIGVVEHASRRSGPSLGTALHVGKRAPSTMFID